MKAILLATAALAVFGALTPQAALAQSQRQKQQDDKNLMRNLSLGLGVAALDRLRKGDKEAALALVAGAAYTAKKYEDQRKSQSDCYGDRYGDSRWDDRRDSRSDDRYSRDSHSRYERDDRWSRDRDDDRYSRDDRRDSRSKSRYSRNDRDDRGCH